MRTKERIDILLFEQGLCNSREKARAEIMAGNVYVAGHRIEKPGIKVPRHSTIEIRRTTLPYVSRGGLKLEKALAEFAVNLEGKIVLDVGASTGGFTDCALRHGAEKVFAVDVGYGQLAWSLRQDARVRCLERTNIRYLAADALAAEQPNFFTVDVAFISLALVLPKVFELTSGDAEGIVLIKPQFEAGRKQVGKKGVVRDPAVHQEVLTRVLEQAGSNWGVKGLSFSPLRGPQGNIEYLAYLTKNCKLALDLAAEIDRVVTEASRSLR